MVVVAVESASVGPAPLQLAVWATVNILDWKLVLWMGLSVGCLQQPTAITLKSHHGMETQQSTCDLELCVTCLKLRSLHYVM